MDRSIETMNNNTANVFLLGFCVIIVQSCGPSSEASDSEAQTRARMREYETQFDPSAYNPDVKEILREEFSKGQEHSETRVEVSNQAPPELVPGFRVQVFASTNIDDAARTKETVEGLFPGEWFYLVYDPPTYKIRGGNFGSRFEAERFMKQVSQSGFKDAWIVPDRVYKNPAHRPADRSPVGDDNSGNR